MVGDPKVSQPQPKSLDPRDWIDIGDYWRYVESLGWRAESVTSIIGEKPRIKVQWLPTT